VGEIARDEWLQTAALRPNVEVDSFVVMPNHVHAILFLDRAWQRHAPTSETKRAFSKPIAGSLATIIGAYKSVVARKINQLRNTPGNPVWQRNYHEHVVRNEKSLNMLREYVQHNPSKWAEDRVNPANL
jgi:REP element-mobilizing transposase RayT